MKEEYRKQMNIVFQEILLHLKKCNYCHTVLEMDALYPKRGCYCDYDCFKRYRQRKIRDKFFLTLSLD